MNKSIISIFTILIMASCNKVNTDKGIESVVLSYVKAGDERDINVLKKSLHVNYRALANRVFESEELQVLSRETYLSLIEKGTIGGDSRRVDIHSIDISGNNAMVKATFTGNDHIFHTYMLLVRDTDDQWSIVSDLPEVVKLY